MSKELEAWNFVRKDKTNKLKLTKEKYNEFAGIVDKALARLEAIDNANPSEALKLAELLECDLQATNDLVTRTINGYDYLDILETIKQALINAQEKEKEKLLFKNIHNTKVKTPLVSIFNGLSKEERYKFTEHIYYNWEEMKEELEDMNKELEKENELLKERIQFLEKEYNNLMEDKDNLESELFKHKEPKKYLKCDDLEFDDDWKYQEVKLNGTKYTIKYKCGFDFFDNYYEVIKIYNQNERKQLFKLYNNDKFFNDLHLEKV